jgi:glycosyltransferase involved in cell wall biosynthesis
MNVGIVPILNPSFGGGHQYSLAMLDAVGTLASQAKLGESHTIFIRPEEREFLPKLDGIAANQIVEHASFSYSACVNMKHWLGEGMIRKVIRGIRLGMMHRRHVDPDRIRPDPEFAKCLDQCGIDWVLYTGTDSRTFEAGKPYVMPIFDLQHRFQPEFPEVSADGEWEEREYVFRNGTRHATLILAGSEASKEEILDCYGGYGITTERVKILPYLPAPYLCPDVSSEERAIVRRQYSLPERYFFYPAQLWPHKNHVRLVQALGLLKADHQSDIHLVFCGTHQGRIRTWVYQDMMREAHRLKVAEQIHYFDYVPNEAMSALYAEAVALVMPTFFGPTNIPVIEAWLFGCPVLTSDIRGIRQHVGDAGLLVDPTSVEALAAAMGRLWNERGLRSQLAERGTQRLTNHSHVDFCTKLAEIFAEAEQRIAELRSPRCRVAWGAAS